MRNARILYVHHIRLRADVVWTQNAHLWKIDMLGARDVAYVHSVLYICVLCIHGYMGLFSLSNIKITKIFVSGSQGTSNHYIRRQQQFDCMA